MDDSIYPVAAAISNAAALVLLGCAWKYPNIARFLFFGLFLWTACVNAVTAVNHPEVYLEYSRLTVFDFYRNFIEGFFAGHITAVVLTVALFQLAIAVLMWWEGAWFRAGCAGAILFLVAVVPLGVGSAFPSTLIMAAAVVLLLRKKHVEFLWRHLVHLQGYIDATPDVL